jgi:hypothetical protein
VSVPATQNGMHDSAARRKPFITNQAESLFYTKDTGQYQLRQLKQHLNPQQQNNHAIKIPSEYEREARSECLILEKPKLAAVSEGGRKISDARRSPAVLPVQVARTDRGRVKATLLQRYQAVRRHVSRF